MRRLLVIVSFVILTAAVVWAVKPLVGTPKPAPVTIPAPATVAATKVENDPLPDAEPAPHLSFSQIQKALKEGRTSFCNCPRCRGISPPHTGGETP